jgi:hypothetical protein
LTALTLKARCQLSQKKKVKSTMHGCRGQCSECGSCSPQLSRRSCGWLARYGRTTQFKEVYRPLNLYIIPLLPACSRSRVITIITHGVILTHSYGTPSATTVPRLWSSTRPPVSGTTTCLCRLQSLQPIPMHYAALACNCSVAPLEWASFLCDTHHQTK